MCDLGNTRAMLSPHCDGPPSCAGYVSTSFIAPVGFVAAFASTPRAAAASPPPAAPSPFPPLQQLAASASTPLELAAAAADPAVSSVTIATDLALAGSAIVVAGAGRALLVQSDPGACGSRSCVMDARWLSRHFEARYRAQTRLSAV